MISPTHNGDIVVVDAIEGEEVARRYVTRPYQDAVWWLCCELLNLFDDDAALRVCAKWMGIYTGGVCEYEQLSNGARFELSWPEPDYSDDMQMIRDYEKRTGKKLPVIT